MARIAPMTGIQPKPRKERHTANEADYFAFIASLPCCLTGGPAQVAHINIANRAYGHMGRGKSEKAHYTWTLPMAPEPHHEMDGSNFTEWWKFKSDGWAQPDDTVFLSPHDLCTRLARVYLEYPDPDRIAVATQVIEAWRAGE